MDKNKDIVLVQVENAWAPKRAKSTAKDVNTQNIEIVKQLKLIINKLSEDNLPHTTGKIRRLSINNEELLKIVVDIIFIREINETFYINLYAQLCKQIQNIEIINNENTVIDFKPCIMERCRDEYHTKIYGSTLAPDYRVLTVSHLFFPTLTVKV